MYKLSFSPFRPFDFRCFWSICTAKLYYRSCINTATSAGHSTVTVADRIVRAPLVHSTAKCAKVGLRDGLGMFFAYKKILGRTRDRMYYQTIRTVRDISRDDKARITTCSLRTPTDRHCIDYCITPVTHHAALSMLIFW